MKFLFSFTISIFILSSLGLCQEKKEVEVKETKKRTVKQCTANSDKLYDREQVLEKLAGILNDSVAGYTGVQRQRYSVGDEKPKQFFIYDLIDTSNKGTPLFDCVEMINNHVYHFSPIYIPHSFSHIVILEHGNLKVFKSINCVGSGDSIEEVIDYLNQKLKNYNDEDKERILNQVKSYRKYGLYDTVDDDALACKSVESN